MYHRFLERDTVLLVEEYGVTRYKKFEQSLQILRNLNRFYPRCSNLLNYKHSNALGLQSRTRADFEGFFF